MSTSVTSVTSHFPSAQNGFTTTLASTIASGAATVPLNSVAGYTNGQIAVFVVDPTDASKKQTFTGTIDTAGVQVTSVVWTAGTNQTHSAGSTVVDYATATHISMVSKGLLVEHKQAGTHAAVTADSVTVATGKITTTAVGKLEDAATPLTTYRTNFLFDFVASGGVWSGDSYGGSLNASMTAMVCYINGRRIAISAVTSRAFTTNVDTYIDVLDNADGTGTLVYTTAVTNATAPALAANSLRIGIIQAAATITASTKVNQGQEDRVFPIASSIAYSVTDNLGNLICPRDPQRRILGYRQVLTDQTTTSGTYVDVTGLSCPVIVPTGRKVIVKGYMGAAQQGASATNAAMNVYDATASVQLNEYDFSTSSFFGLSPQQTYTPPASGARTFKSQFKSDGTRTLHTTGGATTAVWIQVELA